MTQEYLGFMTLEEYLDFNIQHITRLAKELPSGRDIRPIFSYITEDDRIVAADVAEGMTSSTAKNIMSAWCRQRLREERARMYSLFSPAWYVMRKNPTPEVARELKRTMEREGTDGRYADERVECVWVQVADRERSVFVVLDVKRDYKGEDPRGCAEN